MPACTFEKYSSLSTWWASLTARSDPRVTMYVCLPSGPSGYSQTSEPSAFFLTVSGAPSFAWTCCAGMPLETAAKFAHPARDAASASGRRLRAAFGMSSIQ